MAEVDRLIVNSDSVALLKIVQTVATNDALTCDQRISYLLEVLGRIKTAVESKQFSADQLKVIISGAQTEVGRLQAEINRLEGEITNLWIGEIQDQLRVTLTQLEDLYSRFNAVEREVAPKEAEVAGIKREIDIINAASDEERNRISNDRIKLTEAQALIRDLENRLADAREQRTTIEAAILRAEATISSDSAKITDARAKIKALEAEIRSLQDKSDGLRAQYSDIEIEVERLRVEISIAETKAENYRN